MSRLSQPDSSEIPARPKGPGFESSHPTVQNWSRRWRHRQEAHVLNEKIAIGPTHCGRKWGPIEQKPESEILTRRCAISRPPPPIREMKKKNRNFFFDRAKDLETENLAPPNFGQNSKSCIDNFFIGMKICDILGAKFKFCGSMQRKNNLLRLLE